MTRSYASMQLSIKSVRLKKSGNINTASIYVILLIRKLIHFIFFYFCYVAIVKTPKNTTTKVKMQQSLWRYLAICLLLKCKSATFKTKLSLVGQICKTLSYDSCLHITCRHPPEFHRRGYSPERKQDSQLLSFSLIQILPCCGLLFTRLSAKRWHCWPLAETETFRGISTQEIPEFPWPLGKITLKQRFLKLILLDSETRPQPMVYASKPFMVQTAEC